jgi:hypothetical protein
VTLSAHECSNNSRPSLILIHHATSQRFDGSVWGTGHNCIEQLFCARLCLAFVEDIVRNKHSWPRDKYGHGTCQMMARAHANLYDYEQGLKSASSKARPVFMTMLREPAQRAVGIRPRDAQPGGTVRREAKPGVGLQLHRTPPRD